MSSDACWGVGNIADKLSVMYYCGPWLLIIIGPTKVMAQKWAARETPACRHRSPSNGRQYRRNGDNTPHMWASKSSKIICVTHNIFRKCRDNRPRATLSLCEILTAQRIWVASAHAIEKYCKAIEILSIFISEAIDMRHIKVYEISKRRRKK